MTSFYDLAQTMTDNAVYCGLFGFTIATANKHLNLPPSATENERRDEMGVLALQALATIERIVTLKLMGNVVTLEETISMARYIAADIGMYYRDRGVGGVLLLTADDVMNARRK